jgi:2-methylisocitrate lyase-like PEP mutase family enzyme
MKKSRASQKEKAERLLSLHTGGDLLILPNVWNPIGARMLEQKGYPAVATASAAVSASLGYRDGEKIRRETLLDIIGRIARSVEVPVSADIEAGYGESLSELERTTEQVIDTGVVGVNIEDSREEEGVLRAVEAQCQRIALVRQTAERRGLHLVINARVDTFVSSAFRSDEQALEETVARARAYAAAGADCIYPMGPGDQTTVRLLRWRIESPINILASPSATPLSVLRDIGVNRVSFGPFIFRSLLRKFSNIADVLLTTGDYASFADMMSREETGEYLLDGHEPSVGNE